MISQWLNTTFFSFDYSILEFFHKLAENAGTILTPLAEFFAIIGDNGYFGFFVAIILMLFPKTRKCGLCVAFAIAFGALFTNIAIKNIVARPRPYASGVEAFNQWWTFIGAPIESEFSFPSGHTTAAMASMTALCIAIGKSRKWIIAPAALYVLIMGASRNYLCVHYPTDVIAGILVGGVAAVASFFTIRAIWSLIEKNQQNKLFAFAINFDITSLFHKNTSNDTGSSKENQSKDE